MLRLGTVGRLPMQTTSALIASSITPWAGPTRGFPRARIRGPARGYPIGRTRTPVLVGTTDSGCPHTANGRQP
jgi:hypothetical protein